MIHLDDVLCGIESCADGYELQYTNISGCETCYCGYSDTCNDPTVAPSDIPSELPTGYPSKTPSQSPTPDPTQYPTQDPTRFDCVDINEICELLDCYDSACYLLGCFNLDNEFVINNQCPNYDTTVYSDCSGDTHCIDCQSWGCADCEIGYYKMGNLMRCQSCSDNYQNCQECSDFNGCTTCQSGYTLQYDSTCNDQICL